MENLEDRIAFVDVFDRCWAERWRPARWAGAIDGLYGRLSIDGLGRLAREAPTWDSFVEASGATPVEWSPSDGPHDQWGNPIEGDLHDSTGRLHTQQLLAKTYVEQLTGRTPDRSGLVKCPFHKGGQERTASLALNGPYWKCFGCDAGGSIIDFVARLWGLDTKGADYIEIKRRLRDVGIA